MENVRGYEEINMGYDEREMRRRKRRRAEQMRKRQLRRKIKLCIRLCAAAIVLVILANFISGLSQFRGHGLRGLFARSGDAKAENGDTDAVYVDADKANLVYPQVKEGKELYNALQKLAESDSEYQEIMNHYDEYPQKLLAALCSNPEMLPFVQGYLESDGQAHGGFEQKELDAGIPLLIQWDKRWGYAAYGDSNIALSGCAPTCLSMVIVSITGDLTATPDQIADYAMKQGYYLEGTGTAWSIMTEGAAHYGVTGQEVSLDESAIKRHLEAGEPIICSMRPGDFTTAGHFIVLTGVVDGKITVNDPNSRARSSVLWDYDRIASQIKNLWAFTRS